MEILPVLALYSLVFFFKESESQRVPDESLSRGCRGLRGQFPHETFCHQYYNCWDGKATIEQCPGDLLFSNIKFACDYPESVSCGGRIRNPAPFISGGRCLKEWGTFPDPLDCTAFYECAHGRAFHKYCPLYTAFDDRYLVCVHAYDVECGGRGGIYGPMSSPPIFSQIDPSSIRSGSGRSHNIGSVIGWERRPQQAGPITGFMKGSNVAIPLPLPPGPMTSARTSTSVFGRTAPRGPISPGDGGGGPLTSIVGRTGPRGPISSGDGGSGPSTIADPIAQTSGASKSPENSDLATDTGPFADSLTGDTGLPIGSVGFDSGSSADLHDGIIGIIDKDIPPTDREKQFEKPISPEATFRCPHPRGLFAHAIDCTKFWLCREYRPSLLKCPTDLLFDVTTLTCRRPEIAQCSTLTPRT